MREYPERNDEKQFTCPWKGDAQYWDVVVGRRRGPAAQEIAGYVAFGEDVQVSD